MNSLSKTLAAAAAVIGIGAQDVQAQGPVFQAPSGPRDFPIARQPTPEERARYAEEAHCSDVRRTLILLARPQSGYELQDLRQDILDGKLHEHDVRDIQTRLPAETRRLNENAVGAMDMDWSVLRMQTNSRMFGVTQMSDWATTHTGYYLARIQPVMREAMTERLLGHWSREQAVEHFAAAYAERGRVAAAWLDTVQAVSPRGQAPEAHPTCFRPASP